MPGSTDCAGIGDERDDDADQRRADVYSSARIGVPAALTIVLVVLLVLDVAVPDYDISPGILLPLLGAILALPGLETTAPAHPRVPYAGRAACARSRARKGAVTARDP